MIGGQLKVCEVRGEVHVIIKKRCLTLLIEVNLVLPENQPLRTLFLPLLSLLVSEPFCVTTY